MDREQSELIEGEVIINNDPSVDEVVAPAEAPVARQSSVNLGSAKPDEIRAEIERTRAAMDGTIDRLNARLKPRHLLDDVLNYFENTSASGPGGGQRSLRDAGQMAVGKLKQNPIPAGLIGSGLAWLLFQGTGQSPTASYDSYQPGSSDESGTAESVKQTLAETGDKLHAATDRVAGKAQDAKNALGGMLESAPLALGVGALAAGLLAGLVLPGTRTEDELMGGEASDQVKDTAREAGSALASEVRETASSTIGHKSKIDRMWDR